MKIVGALARKQLCTFGRTSTKSNCGSTNVLLAVKVLNYIILLLYRFNSYINKKNLSTILRTTRIEQLAEECQRSMQWWLKKEGYTAEWNSSFDQTGFRQWVSLSWTENIVAKENKHNPGKTRLSGHRRWVAVMKSTGSAGCSLHIPELSE